MIVNNFKSVCLILLATFTDLDCYQVKSGPLLTERPPWLKACKRSDPELNKCFTELFTEIFPHLAVGIPEINVDPFEPLPLDKVSVSKGAGPVTLAGSLNDLYVSGPSNATPTYSIVDLPGKKINFGIDLPLLEINARYNLKGKILVLPLVGSGKCDLKLKDVKTMVFTNVSFYEKEGRELLRFDKMKVAFTIKGMRVNFENLFNGNKILGLTMNNFINQNAIEVVAELEDNIGQSLAAIFLDLINNVFSKVPTDLWLPKEEGDKVSEEQVQDSQHKE